MMYGSIKGSLKKSQKLDTAASLILADVFKSLKVEYPQKRSLRHPLDNPDLDRDLDREIVVLANTIPCMPCDAITRPLCP